MIIDNRSKKFTTDEKVLIECDFKASPKCKGKFLKVYKNILKCQANNDGKDMCCFCFNALTKTGKNNYNFKYEKNEDFFENIDTELKAYLLGIIAGDGCILKDGMKIEMHKQDIYVLELLRDYISPNSNIKLRKYEKYDNTICLQIYSVKLVKDLLRALKLKKVGKKSHDILLPDLSDDLMWHFIRGLVDSDGHIGDIKYNPIISYCSMSKIIKEEIIIFCNKFDIQTKTERHSICWYGENCVKIINKLYNNFDCNFSLERKRIRAKIWSTWVRGKGHILKEIKPRKLYIRKSYIPSELQKQNLKNMNIRKRKLTMEEAQEMRYLKINEDFTYAELADKYKVSQATVYHILHNKMYKE